MTQNQKILRNVTMMEALAGNILNLGSSIRKELGNGSSPAPRKGNQRKEKAEGLRKRSVVNSIKRGAVATLLIVTLFSCKKDVELITPHYDYSAKITAQMSDKTISYNIYVRVDTLWIYVSTKSKIEIEKNEMGFNIPYFVCAGITYPHDLSFEVVKDANKKITTYLKNKIAIIERYSTGNYDYGEKPLDSTHVTIIKN